MIALIALLTGAPSSAEAGTPPTNLGVPTISPGSTFGSLLTCDPGSWTGSPTSYDYTWTAAGVPISGATSSTYVIVESVGTLLRCVVVATNLYGSTPANSAGRPVTVSAPTNEAIPTLSGSTSTGSTLTCAPGAWNPAGPALTYAWSANGVTIGSADVSTYVITQAPGTLLRCTVTATTAGGTANSTTAPLTVGATPPGNTAVPVVTGGTTLGSTLTCSNGTWTGSPTVYAFTWTSNGTPIPGEHGSTHVIAEALGSVLRCVVTVTNSGGSLSATSAPKTVTIGAPASTFAPVVTGATFTGSTLTCSTGSWTPAATSYAYAWAADGSAIPGASSSTHVVVEPVGTDLECLVIATNVGGSNVALSNSIIVTTAPPLSTAQPVITGSTVLGSTLTCSTGGWTGSPSFTFAWTANGSTIPGATTSTHVVAESIGTQLRCQVTATNAGGTNSSLSSIVTVSLVNAPASMLLPSISGVTNVGSILTCDRGTWSNSPTSYAYSWTANGAPVAGAASVNLAITQAAGVLLRCVVVASNSGGNNIATSPAVTVTSIGPPTLVASPTIAGTTRIGSMATCNTGMWTGAPTGYSYAWSANGVAIGGATTASYVIVNGAGTQLRCAVTATNAGGSTGAVSLPITATEPVPTNLASPSIGGRTTDGSILTCSPGTWGGNPTLTYVWVADGTPIPTATAATYTIHQPAGTLVRCEVTATNGSGTAGANSPSVYVEAAVDRLLATSMPAVQTLAGRPAGAYVNGIVRCFPGTWVASEAPMYRFAWKLGGSTVEGAISREFVIPPGTAGRTLSCGVTAVTNGASANARSTSVLIASHNLILGDDAADSRFGTTGNDKIVLRGGADTARALAGDDQIYGDDGNDMLLGGVGRDLIFGGNGADRLYGDDGNDVIDARDASSAVDRVDCGAGRRDIALVNRRDTVTGCEVVRRYP